MIKKPKYGIITEGLNLEMKNKNKKNHSLFYEKRLLFDLDQPGHTSREGRPDVNSFEYWDNEENSKKIKETKESGRDKYNFIQISNTLEKLYPELKQIF